MSTIGIQTLSLTFSANKLESAPSRVGTEVTSPARVTNSCYQRATPVSSHSHRLETHDRSVQEREAGLAEAETGARDRISSDKEQGKRMKFKARSGTLKNAFSLSVETDFLGGTA